MDGRVRFAIWMLFVCSLLGRSAAASSVVVPDQFSTIQAAIDSGADSVVVRPGLYDEALVIDRGVALLGLLDPSHPTELPQVSGLCVSVADSKKPISNSFRLIHFLGPVGISAIGFGARLDFQLCHLDSGLGEGGSSTNMAILTLSNCVVHGPLNASLGSVWFDDNEFFGGIRIYCEGSINIRGNKIMDRRRMDSTS